MDFVKRSPLGFFFIFFFFFFDRLKEAQENIKKITADKRVETKQINANSLVSSRVRHAGPGLWPQRLSLLSLSAEREAAAEGGRRLLQLSSPTGRRVWPGGSVAASRESLGHSDSPGPSPLVNPAVVALLHPQTPGCGCTADAADMTSVSKAKGRSRPASTA